MFVASSAARAHKANRPARIVVDMRLPRSRDKWSIGCSPSLSAPLVPNLKARPAYLEMVKPSPAYWPSKAPIGTAVAKRLPDDTSNGSRTEPAYPKRPARPVEALEGLDLFSRGRAANETRRTEIASSPGVGSLAQNPAYRSTSADCKGHLKVFL